MLSRYSTDLMFHLNNGHITLHFSCSTAKVLYSQQKISGLLKCGFHVKKDCLFETTPINYNLVESDK